MVSQVKVKNNKEGKIIKINKDLYTVKLNDSVLSCYVRGKLKNEKLVVGDNVKVDIENKMIEELIPRKNSLIRPLVANIDKLFIVVSTTIPSFSEFLLDKMIVLSSLENIEPIIIITKLDESEYKTKKYVTSIMKYYKKYYKVYKNTEIRKIEKEIKNSTVALCGQTGAGKSTLLNKIDKKLKLNTGEVSKSLGRGKHTTRIVELININDGLIADTPGFSSLELTCKKEQIKEVFPEFKVNCKYTGCLHIKENGCEVIEKVKNNKILKSRYESYLKLIKEVD